MKEKSLLWIPRILAILAILFMMLFSLDCFEAGQGLRNQLTCFVMHNIPAFIIAVILFISWKWELLGGLLFMAAAVAGSIFFNGFGGNWGVNIIMAPFLLAGVLFMIHHYKYVKKAKQTGQIPQG